MKYKNTLYHTFSILLYSIILCILPVQTRALAFNNEPEKLLLSDNPYLSAFNQLHEKEKTPRIKEWITLFKSKDDIVLRKQLAAVFQYVLPSVEDQNMRKELLQLNSLYYYIIKDYSKMLDYELQLLNLLEKTKDKYALYSTYHNIALVKAHLEQYSEAQVYFTKAADYFKQHIDDYDHLLGFENTKRYQALCAFYLKQHAQCNLFLEEGYAVLDKLKKEDFFYDEAYYHLVKGMNLYALNDSHQSVLFLQKALPAIIKNDDFANEALSYMYLGLNAQKENNLEEAVTYFKKIDAIYTQHEYANLQTVNVYNHIIAYYRQKDDTERQLYYMNRYLVVMQHLQKEYKYLQEVLHIDLDTRTAQKEKIRLEETLRKEQRNQWLLAGTAAVLIIALLSFLWKTWKRKKMFFQQYQKLQLQLKEIAHTEEPQLFVNLKTVTTGGIPETNWSSYHPEVDTFEQDVLDTNEGYTEDKKSIPDEMAQKILQQLELFEKQKLFLEPEVSLIQMAQQFNTNRSYLSQCINAYKGVSFTEYINTLRINYLLHQWQINPKWRSFKLQSLSETLGFRSRRSFANAFNSCTGLSPTNYLQQLLNDSSLKHEKLPPANNAFVGHKITNEITE